MSKRILIAEDDEAIATLIAMNLRAAGMEPAVFPDGEYALLSEPYRKVSTVHRDDEWRQGVSERSYRVPFSQ